ncbi:MAG: glycoside hydrolase family 99-like domain-containing protein [Anaerolineae bacterium]
MGSSQPITGQVDNHLGRVTFVAFLASFLLLGGLLWMDGDGSVQLASHSEIAPTEAIQTVATLTPTPVATASPTTTATPTVNAGAMATIQAANTAEVEATAKAELRLTSSAQTQATTLALVLAAYTVQAQATSEAEAAQAAAMATVQAVETVTAVAANTPTPAALAIAVQADTSELEATIETGNAEATATVVLTPEATAILELTATPEATPTPEPLPAPAGPGRYPRLVLASYFPWYDDATWDGCNISNGDKPLQPYSSDDPAAIARQVQMALGAGIDGFVSHWFAPGERTDRNFAQILAQSQGTGFQSTVMFLRSQWPGSPAPTQQNVAEALRYIIGTYGSHPNFLRLEGKPVIFFADVYRVPTVAGQSPQDAWQAIRNQVDPGGNTWWIAEGLDPLYLTVFDGLYVYKITHAAFPNDYVKSPRWGAQVRQWEQNTGKPKLWIATITPGWDDLRAGCKADIRVPSQPHRREREDGAFYRATFDSAIASAPDWLLVQTFNEWVEGSYIEPSVQYGDRYLQLTREFAASFKQ